MNVQKSEKKNWSVLLVDDQYNVVEGLLNGICWKELGISCVFSAYSSMEAKLILLQNKIDILICDIEMPQENGLQLYKWCLDRKLDILCIFLTAYADFLYAKSAMQMGGFEYILQPARYSEVENVIVRAQQKIMQDREQKKYSAYGKLVFEEREEILDSLVENWYRARADRYSAEKLQRYLEEIGQQKGRRWIQFLLIEFSENGIRWEKDLLRFSIKNIIGELLDECEIAFFVGSLDEKVWYCLLNGFEAELTEENLIPVMGEFEKQAGMVFGRSIVVCSGKPGRIDAYGDNLKELEKAKQEKYGCCKIELGTVPECADVIDKVKQYVYQNLDREIHRDDIAGDLFLNSSYLSRIFKQKTGISLKKFIIQEKMKLARTFLQNSDLNISVVAMRVGYTNFSHFSQTYRNEFGVSPSEERKNAGNFFDRDEVTKITDRS